MTASARHTSEGGRPHGGAEHLRLDADDLRFVADWVHTTDPVWAEVPAEIADLVRLHRADRAGLHRADGAGGR